MRSGRLRHRVTVQTATTTANDFGEPVETWGTYVTRWASVEPLQGREFFSAQQNNSEVTTRVRMRYTDGITPKMRISHNGRILRIHSVINPEDRNRELELMCSELNQ